MAKHLELGEKGEKAAVRYLHCRGYNIIECNWRFKKAEIDIICRKDEILIFVEVKTRSYTYYGTPDAFVNKRKQRLLVDAAVEYMKLAGHEWIFRFDIVSVVIQSGILKIEHIQDAFFPGLSE